IVEEANTDGSVRGRSTDEEAERQIAAEGSIGTAMQRLEVGDYGELRILRPVQRVEAGRGGQDTLLHVHAVVVSGGRIDGNTKAAYGSRCDRPAYARRDQLVSRKTETVDFVSG